MPSIRSETLPNGLPLHRVELEGTRAVTVLVAFQAGARTERAEENGMAGASYSDIATSDKVHSMMADYVDELNTRLNRWETIKRWDLLEHDLTVESGELTPSMKVKRNVVETNYQDRIDALYA